MFKNLFSVGFHNLIMSSLSDIIGDKDKVFGKDKAIVKEKVMDKPKVIENEKNKVLDKNKDVNDKPKESTSRGTKKNLEETDHFSKLCKVMQDGFLGMQATMKDLGNDISNNIVENIRPYYEEDHESDQLEEDLEDIEQEVSINVLQEIQKDFILDVPSAPPVNAEVAKMINNMLSVSASDASAKARIERQVRPENCEFAQAPKTNPEIWNSIPGTCRATDMSLQDVQGKILNGIVPIAKTIDSLYAVVNNGNMDQLKLKDMIKDLSDSVASIGAANLALIKQRRDHIKTVLPTNMQRLCNSSVKFSGSLLFGDNLTQQMKEIADCNKITAELTPVKKWPQSFRGSCFRGRYPTMFRRSGKWTGTRGGRGAPYAARGGPNLTRAGPYDASKRLNRRRPFGNRL
jgi:hypothetical protein